MSDMSISSAESFAVVLNLEKTYCVSLELCIQSARWILADYIGKHHQKILHLLTASLNRDITDCSWDNGTHGITIMKIISGSAGDFRFAHRYV